MQMVASSVHYYLERRYMSSYCPPDNGDDDRVACYAHCRNAVSPYVAPDRWTPLRPDDFEDCMQGCNECRASRTFWHSCVENALLNDDEYQALSRRASGCRRCRHMMRAIEDYYIDQCT